VLAICEGSRSRTFSHFRGKFGAADFTLYGLDGEQLSDMVLGLRVKSLLPDPMAVLLTVAQNRFLLNSLRINGMPDDVALRKHLESLSGSLLHTLLVSGPWDTANVGGKEVDIDWLLEGPQLGQNDVTNELSPFPAR
jgi:hypothetical protein